MFQVALVLLSLFAERGETFDEEIPAQRAERTKPRAEAEGRCPGSTGANLLAA